MPVKSKLARSLRLLAALTVAAVFTSGCTCGFDCSSDDDVVAGPAILTLGLSDALPDDLEEVVLEIDSIVLGRSGGGNITIDTFPVGAPDPNQPVDSFMIDLLDYRNIRQLVVVEDLELDTGNYSSITINLTPESSSGSYVTESDDTRHNLMTDDGGLELPGFSLSSGNEEYTIEFDLALSLRVEESDGRYRLTANGVRIVDNADSTSLSGRVDEELFNTVSPCSEKTDPLRGNRVYLYEGVGLDPESLGDVFTDETVSDIVAPISVSSVTESGSGSYEYVFSFLPAGEYTIAFTCDAEEDDPDSYDVLSLPFPTDKVFEVDLSASGGNTCDIVFESQTQC